MFSPLVALVSLLCLDVSLAAPNPIATPVVVKRAESNEVVALFKRQNGAGQIPPTSSLPKAWLDKLATLTLPNIPIASGTGRPTYGSLSPTSSEVCSFTYECDNPEDLKVPPAGRLALTFDDGPAEGSEALWKLLTDLGARGQVTHFMIGSYITRNTALFSKIASEGGHIAVHTWSHNYMTTLTNEQVVGELGWAMQIMADLNGGRVPRYWRPPFGDVDNRVRAIAKGVFGLETVTWSQDTGDWNLDQGRDATVESVSRTFIGWLNNTSVGLNVLEHEVRPSQPEVLKNVYPEAIKLGWKVGNVADAWGLPWYHNALNANSTVSSMTVGGAAPSIASGGSTGSAAGSSAAAGTGSQSASVTTGGSASRSASATVSAAAAASSSRSAGQVLEKKGLAVAAVGALVGWLVL